MILNLSQYLINHSLKTHQTWDQLIYCFTSVTCNYLDHE